MNNKSDRRDFDGFPIGVVVEVGSEDSEGNKFNDRPVVKDISGEGAISITQQAGTYFLGQSLKMTVFLPGNSDVKAHMRGKSSVIGIGRSSNSDRGQEIREIDIAVKLDTPLYFESVDVKTQGNHGEPSESL